MNLTITHRIEPKVDLANGVIMLDELERNPLLDVSPAREILERHARQVIDTREQAVRAALIRLGWTPPPEGVAGSHGLTADTPSAETVARVRAHDPSSSIAAAERAGLFASSHKERILRAMRDDELSSHQIAKFSGLTVVQVDRRLHELRNEGVIEVVSDGDGDLLRSGYRVWRRVRSSKN